MAITALGESQSFAYTGGVQTFTAPFAGIYKLEVYGAGGGPGHGIDGTGKYPARGGYSVGYKKLAKGQVLYVVCGGRGKATHKEGGTPGGYNGGGAGGLTYGSDDNYNYYYQSGGSGGGATHIATATGTLASLSGNRGAVLIVAGGGGGRCFGNANEAKGSTTVGVPVGGGLEGGSTFYGGTTNVLLQGGTQTTGHAFGQGGDGLRRYLGSGDGAYWQAAGGGGGGWYGGRGSSDPAQSGSGGSGYIGGVPAFTVSGKTYSPSTTAGANGSVPANTWDELPDGKAIITYVAKGELPVIFNGTTLEKIIFNGTEITSLIYNGTKLFARRLRGALRRWRTCSDWKEAESC